MNVQVSVIVPARDAADTIASQISALIGQRTTRSWELIVVDNGSSDGTAAVVEQAVAGAVPFRVVTADGAVGAGYARNCGAAMARGERLLFCDADDVVSADWLERMAAALENHGLVGGGIDRRRFNPGADFMDQPSMDRLAIATGGDSFAMSCNLGIARELFVQLGGFDARFVTGSEDVDLSLRAAAVGVTPFFVDGAPVDYREPRQIVAVFLRHRGYGLSEPQLRRAHPRLRRNSLATAARNWAAMVVLVAKAFVRSTGRSTAAKVAGRSLGRLEGSIRYRTWYP